MVRKPNPANTGKVRTAIINAPISQANIARKLGISDVSVHRWAVELRKPSPENLVLLAAVCGVAVSDMTDND